jgi:protein SCO1
MQKLSILLVLATFACSQHKTLPIMGERQTISSIQNGQQIIDTVYHQIASFALFNQDSVLVKNGDFLGKKIYVADFFFTSCPTICPKMKTNMLRLYKQYKGYHEVAFLSHTIDPRHDTVPALKLYANKLGIQGNQWQFVTGPKETVYELAQKSYLTSALEDSTAAGGFVHSGAFTLIDSQQRVRGVYDGTKAAEVDKLAEDIQILLKETKSNAK